MDVLQPVEPLRGRRRASWVFDGLLAVVAAFPILPADATGRATLPVALLLFVLSAGILLVRRIWPLPAFVALWLVTAVVGILDVHVAVQVGLLFAINSVAVRSPRRHLVVAAVMLEVGVVAASIRLSGGSWWITAILLSGMAAAAVGIGLYRGARRAYLTELQDRASRLERERDQQGALAAAAERARIAREMHDIVAHHLTVMVALSDGAAAASGRSPEQAAEAMRTVSRTGREALADTRRLLGVLRETPTTDTPARRPLPDLTDLDELVTRVRAAGLPVRYEVHGEDAPIPPGVQLTLYRLVQEALTNTLKHAGEGASATVRLHYAPDEVTVDVEDDGVGLALAGRVNPGRGLLGMQERVTAFGGEVSTGPRSGGPVGRGWRVSARMRLDEGGTA